MIKELVNDREKEADKVLALIDSMTRQTQWLAMNATLEAARTGEQGRGLGRVAEQVRQLAGRIKSSGLQMQECLAAAANDGGETQPEQERGMSIRQARQNLAELSAELYQLAAQFRSRN